MPGPSEDQPEGSQRAGEAIVERGARPSWQRWLWLGIGAVLMVLAVWVSVRSGGMIDALAALADAGPLIVAALLALPLISWVLTSSLFWVLTRRFGHVGWMEMSALIGAAWLLNVLPMRPGMVGRVAYHRSVNGIPVRASVRVLVEVLICSGLAGVLALAGLALLAGKVFAGAGFTVLAVAAGAGALLALRRRGTGLPAGLLLIGTGIRLADIASWAVRYWLLLRLAGLPVSAMEAMVVTLAGLLASLTPVQFGLREWAVGSTASLAGRASGAAVLSMGLAADLLNRGIELMLSLPIGLVCASLLARRVAARRRGAGTSPEGA